MVEILQNKIKQLEAKDSRLGTMEDDCIHDIERLYTKDTLGFANTYKADHCKKCGGVY